MDKTKWYRINYEKLHFSTEQDAISTTAELAQEELVSRACAALNSKDYTAQAL